MKYFLLFFLALLSTGCQLFQEQQQAGENVATEAKQEEVFVPVEKELYVITHTAMEYAKPNILDQANKPIEPGDEIIGHQNQSWREYQEATEKQNKTRREVIDDYNDLSNLGFEDKRESSSDGGKYRGYEH